MVTVQIKENSQSAKDLIKVLKTLQYVTVEENTPYNLEFVNMVKKAAKGKTTKLDPAKTICENLKLR
jgi:hypothetical protein